MNAKFRRGLDRLLADMQSGTSGNVWPETVERRIGLDVQDGMAGAVIDGEVVDATSNVSSSASMGTATMVPMGKHRARRLRLRRLVHAKRIHRMR